MYSVPAMAKAIDNAKFACSNTFRPPHDDYLCDHPYIEALRYFSHLRGLMRLAIVAARAQLGLDGCVELA